MSPQVDVILQQIEQLNEADRLLLQERLQAWADAQWELEAQGARAVSCERGIDQQTIDDAVEDLRYGS